ncbi:MAG: NAD-dependent epimerase/dehydratase family protein [Actinomycetota bacterium]
MKVLVTGAAGFVGRSLCEALAREHHVTGIDRRHDMPDILDETIVADLSDPGDDALAALRSADAVWHLAARPGVREPGPAAEAARLRDNVVACELVMKQVPADVPVVFTSSSSVYGGSIRNGVVKASEEADPLRPKGGYARSKVRAEEICAARRRRGGAVVVARPFTVVGAGQRPDMALARWVDATLSGEPISVFGSLRRSRDFTDLNEVSRALIRLSATGIGRTVNVGTGVTHSLAELIDAIFDACGRTTEVRIVPAPLEEIPATLARTDLLEELVGFVPRTHLRQVVKRHVEQLAVSVEREYA